MNVAKHAIAAEREKSVLCCNWRNCPLKKEKKKKKEREKADRKKGGTTAAVKAECTPSNNAYKIFPLVLLTHGFEISDNI